LNLSDSLSFDQVLGQVITTYPSVLKAQEAIQSAEAAIGLAKSGYYPNITADAGYARIGPVSQINFPGFGDIKIFPENNYNVSAGVNQTIYDFEKTARNVKLEKSTKEISEKNVELVKQRLTLLTGISYYMLVYLQDAIRIKDLQLETLKKHLDFVTRKEQTGSATQYEILSTQVRISSAENQKVDMQTSRQTQLAILNALLGLPGNTQLLVKDNLALVRPDVRQDSLIGYALDHRYEMILARLRTDHAELHLRSVKAQNNPVLGAFVSGGWKNGYIPDLNAFTANYTAGIGIHYPVFDANRHRNNIKLVNTEINMAREDLNQTTREVSSEVYQNIVGLSASLTKIDQCRLQVQQASQALDLATVSYKAGVITNLDLLDAESNQEQSQLDLLKAQVDYAINVIRLDISIGRPIR
jgi:outer membrane protein TolC